MSHVDQQKRQEFISLKVKSRMFEVLPTPLSFSVQGVYKKRTFKGVLTSLLPAISAYLRLNRVPSFHE